MFATIVTAASLVAVAPWSGSTLSPEEARVLVATMVLPSIGECVDYCVECPFDEHFNWEGEFEYPNYESSWHHDCEDPQSCDFGHVSCWGGTLPDPVAAILGDPVFWQALQSSEGAAIKTFLGNNPLTAVYNQERRALQVFGCGMALIAHVALTDEQVATLDN